MKTGIILLISIYFITVISNINSFIIPLSTDKECIFYKVEESSLHIKGEVRVNNNDDFLVVRIMSLETNKIIHEKVLQKDQKDSIDLIDPPVGIIEICVASKVHKKLLNSKGIPSYKGNTPYVDIVIQDPFHDESHTSKETIEDFNITIVEITRNIILIGSTLLQNTFKRQESAKIVSTLIDTLNNYTVLKIVFLILFCVIQIKMMTIVFSKGSKAVHKIVLNEMSGNINSSFNSNTSINGSFKNKGNNNSSQDEKDQFVL